MILMRETTLACSILIFDGTGTSCSTPSMRVADAQIVFQRLDVDIGRAFIERGAHDLVDEADDGGLGIVVVEDVDFLLHVEGGVVGIAALENGVEGFRADTVAGTESRQNRAPRGHAPCHGLLDFLRDDLPRGEVERVVGEQVEIVVVERRTG